MPSYDLSGTAAGAGGATFGPGHLTHFGAADLAGASTVEGAVGHSMIFTGRVAGQGTLADELLLSALGTAAGVGLITGSLGHLVGLSGHACGQGDLKVSWPEQL